MDFSLFVFIGLCFLAASTGALFRAGPWYQALAKPRWRPPGYLFGPVWLILYGCIAAAGWRAWQAAGPGEALLPMTVYGVHLIFNGLWSAIFFGLRRPGLALADIVCLWLSIAATIAVFAPLDPLAAGLLAPYLAWVTVALALNAAVWHLNRGRPIQGVTL